MPPMLGQLVLFPYDFAPLGWMLCDGSLIPIAQNEALFQLLGTTFGGDGVSTFGIPNLTAVAPPNCNYCIAFIAPAQSVYDGYIGETFPLPNTSPGASDLAKCEGQLLSRAQYPLLATYIGTEFGGNETNFNLPNLSSTPATAYTYRIALQGKGRTPYLGELILLPYSQPVQGLQLCNGALLPIEQNTVLYNLIGTTFGGNSQEFALPDLSAAVPANYNYYIAVTGLFPQRG